MTVMSVPAVTAEWNCTRCGTTNRKLVPADTTQHHRPLQPLPRVARRRAGQPAGALERAAG